MYHAWKGIELLCCWPFKVLVLLTLQSVLLAFRPEERMLVELLFDDETLEELLVVLQVSTALLGELAEQRLYLLCVAVVGQHKGDGDQTGQ